MAKPKVFAVKANRELFDLYESMGRRVTEMRAIIQNDMEITEEDLTQFTDNSLQLMEDFSELAKLTIEHIGRHAK